MFRRTLGYGIIIVLVAFAIAMTVRRRAGRDHYAGALVELGLAVVELSIIEWSAYSRSKR
jgi:hypothetical protein